MKEKINEIINNYIRENIAYLEKEKDKKVSQVNKIIANYSPGEIEKLLKKSNEINELNFAINHMYALIGGLSTYLDNNLKQ